MNNLATRWLSQFYAAAESERDAAEALRAASMAGDLKRWTAALTGVVVRSFESLGLATAARVFPCTTLPIGRQEYLAHDVTVLPGEGTSWRFPIAICELENAGRVDLVAYSLWKVLCVRVALRVVFCYRAQRSEGADLIGTLRRAVVEPMPIPLRTSLEGDTLVVVGSRDEASSFPFGFFQEWSLNTNTGQFERFPRP